jgi:LmbE family N-acetylglucosaminyl deacetylase
MNVLAIGAHPDDIEIGCGAALLAHRRRGDTVAMLVMTTGERGPQDARSRIQEQEDAARFLGARLFWGGFEDGAIPEGRPAVEAIESVIREVGAELVYTHVHRDTHQDHRAAAAASLAAGRRFSRILMYEAPTTQGFSPELFIDVSPFIESKLDVMRIHWSQVLKNGLVDLGAIEALARYRGFQGRVQAAEAFEVERFVWDLSTVPTGVAHAAGLHLALEPT